MTTLERIKLELQEITFTDIELLIFAQENGIPDASAEYDPESNDSKRNMYKTVLSILEAIANNPALMKNYKNDDITITDFADSIQARISMLERKIRLLPSDIDVVDTTQGASFTYMFRE